MQQIEVKVGALIMDPNSSTPIVVLKGIDSEAILPIWIGAYEANAIALEIEKVVPQRPMTHDLIRNLIVELGYRAEKVIVSDLRENTFYASIELTSENGDNKVTLDARPSDAIALALRVDCPIFVEQTVLDISSSNQAQPAEDMAEETPLPDEWPDVIG
jgi:bifunctional DNase/RNase